MNVDALVKKATEIKDKAATVGVQLSDADAVRQASDAIRRQEQAARDLKPSAKRVAIKASADAEASPTAPPPAVFALGGLVTIR